MTTTHTITEPHTLAALDPTGHVQESWDPANADEVAHARSTFDLFRGKGYLAYRVTGAGGQGEQLREFDPQAREIVLTPALRGG